MKLVGTPDDLHALGIAIPLDQLPKRRGYGSIISELLPGDHIHYTAPISYPASPGQARQDALDADEAKRLRKAAKRIK